MNLPLAKIAYDAYCNARGWKSFNGDPLPQFEGQSAELQGAWSVAAEAVVEPSVLAISCTLARVRTDFQVRYLLGTGAETYSRLTAAFALNMGGNVDKLRDDIIPGSAAIHRGGDE